MNRISGMPMRLDMQQVSDREFKIWLIQPCYQKVDTHLIFDVVSRQRPRQIPRGFCDAVDLPLLVPGCAFSGRKRDG